MWELKFTNSVRKYVSLILRLLTVFKFGKAVELRGFFISFTDFILSVLLAVNLSLLKAYTSLKLLLRASKIDLVLPFEDLFSEMSFSMFSLQTLLKLYVVRYTRCLVSVCSV